MRAIVAASMRLGVSLLLMLAVASIIVPAVAAQDAATPVAIPAESTGPTSSASVSVACTPDPASSQTTCIFSTTTGETLTVPAAGICAPVVSIETGAAGDSGYSGAGFVSLSLQGVVTVAGAATYTVDVEGVATAASGPGLSCAVANPDTGGATGATTGSAETGEGDQPSADVSAQPDAGSTAGETDQTGSIDVGGDASGTPETGDTAPLSEPDVAENAAAAPATDGTDGAAFTAAASPVPAAAAQGEPASIDVAVIVYNCATDPAGADPATYADCTPAQGITVSAAQDGTALPSVFTDPMGNATVSAAGGSSLVLTEDQTSIPSGFVPLGNGVQIVNPVAEGASAVFVNIANSGTGHLQIVSGTCPTAGEARTEFRVIGARTFGAAATACTLTPGVSFSLTGGSLGPDGMVVTTGDDASWRGFMPEGTYTVSAGNSSSDPFDVVTDSITAVIVIDYVPMPRGSLVVTRVLCTEGDAEGTSITIDDTPQSDGPGCAANDSDFRISSAGDGTSGPSQDFTLGPDGTAQVDLTAGSYLLTDLASGQQATVTVPEGGTTVANVRQIVLTGRAIVRQYLCSDPASNDADPSDPSYFSDTCTQPLGGASLTLLDGSGNAISTDTASGGGIITWSGLVPGDYSVTSESSLCAVFAEGSDARGGFTVKVGQTTIVNVYRCTAPSGDNTDTGNPGGGTNDGAIGDGTSGGANTGGSDSASTSGGTTAGSASSGSTGDELKNITQLPNTGIGNSDRARSYQFFGALLTLLALVGGSMIATRRRAPNPR